MVSWPPAITASAPGSQYARFEADFRQAVSRAVDYLDLFGVDVEPQSKRYQLSVAYISLTLQASAEGTEESTLVPAEFLFEQLPLRQGRLLIRGDAGSGKSTLFRWVALMAASSGTLLPKKADDGLHSPRSHVDLKNAEDQKITTRLNPIDALESVSGVKGPESPRPGTLRRRTLFPESFAPT